MTNLDAHALDESKLKGLIEDLNTAHIQDIDLSATSSALSSLWDMVVELRSQVADAGKRGVQVKPLVWTPRGDGAQWYAKCPNGMFHYTALPQFREELDGQWMTYLDAIWRPYPTLEAAKAAAQADYEVRIQSCLIDATPDEYTSGRIAGLEEAEKTVRARVMGDGNHDDAEAKRCADAILAMIKQAKGEQG